jgi:hypothetical protein
MICTYCETVFIHDDEVLCEQCKDFLEEHYEEEDMRYQQEHLRRKCIDNPWETKA